MPFAIQLHTPICPGTPTSWRYVSSHPVRLAAVPYPGMTGGKKTGAVGKFGKDSITLFDTGSLREDAALRGSCVSLADITRCIREVRSSIPSIVSEKSFGGQ
jgi:hypothetical protein